MTKKFNTLAEAQKWAKKMKTTILFTEEELNDNLGKNLEYKNSSFIFLSICKAGRGKQISYITTIIKPTAACIKYEEIQQEYKRKTPIL